MKKISEPIVFFGSGPVAAKSLELLSQEFDIEAVITKPKPDSHRGDFPVPILTEKLGLKTMFASNKKELSELFKTKPVLSRLGVVIDYGVIIRQDVIDYFPLGIVNSHFSLLPQWRGADPITFAILSGQDKTGVSLVLIVEKLDEGPLLAQATLPTYKATAPELTENLIGLSHQLLAKTLPSYISGHLKPYPQPVEPAPTYSRKLTKEDGIIDWSKPAVQIEREIRAFIEWPKSRAKLGDVEVIITKAHAVPSDGTPGEIEVLDDIGILIVYCGQGYLCTEKLKPIGKKEMSAKDFIRGYGSRIGKQAAKLN